MLRLAFALVLAITLVGCGSSAEETEVPILPTPTPTPRDWLEATIKDLSALESFRFTLETEARAITLDESGVLTFNQVAGYLVAPDRLRATALVKTPVGNTEVSAIVIGDEEWITNPLNKEWEPAPPDTIGAMTGIFDPETGIGAVLDDIENLERVDGNESVDEIPTVHLRGTIAGVELRDVAPDLAEVPQVQVDLWIGEADTRMRRVVLTEPETEGVTPTWTFLFTEFNAAPAIEPPL